MGLQKNCNTVQLLDKSLQGVKSIFPDATAERIDLYDFPCKRFNGKHYGRCVQKDDLKPILNEIVQAEGSF